MKPTPEIIELLKKSGSHNREEARAATYELAKALEVPLREVVLSGDILGNIYQSVDVTNGVTAEFPLDLMVPGQEKEFIAYTLPKTGAVAYRNVEADYVQVPVFEIGASVDWHKKLARNGRFDIISRAMQILEMGFTKKNNDDGWHTILSAGVDRNALVFDADAQVGQFTKRLLSLAKVVMRRNGGGNSSSVNRSILTDVYMSPESQEDIRNWGIDQLDEISRREIYVAADGQLNRIFGVNLHDVDELGENQEYQDFFTNTLGGSLASGDVELLIGLDQRSRSSFVHPVGADLEIYPEDNARPRRQGMWGIMEGGWAVLDGRNVIVLSC